MTVLDTGDWIALVVGLVAIISSVIAPWVTAKINKRSVLESQSMELFFHAKLKAYNDLISLLSHMDPRSKDQNDLYQFIDTLSRAQIFANSNTFELIERYNASWTSVFFALRENRPHKKLTDQLDRDFRTLLLSMRAELMEFQHPFQKRRRPF